MGTVDNRSINSCSADQLALLKALCNLFNLPLSCIEPKDHQAALELFSGLYMYPAVEGTARRWKALGELEGMWRANFPEVLDKDIWQWVSHTWAKGNAYAGRSNDVNVHDAFLRVYSEMKMDYAKWQRLTMGDPDDMVTGYRWRLAVTGVFETAVSQVVGIKTAIWGVLLSSASRGLEAKVNNSTLREAITVAYRRALSLGSGVFQAVTKGRGVTVVASSGGMAGLLVCSEFLYVYLKLKSEQDDIRDALSVRVLKGELSDDYMKRINSEYDVLELVSKVKWW